MKNILEMKAKELRELYLSASKKIIYAQKRIEHEKNKEIPTVAIKVQSSRKNFPYTPCSSVTTGLDIQEVKESEIIIETC